MQCVPNLLNSVVGFANYVKTKDERHKQAGFGNLFLSIGLLLFALQITNPSVNSKIFPLIVGLIGIYFLDKGKRLDQIAKPTSRKSSPWAITILIIFVSMVLALLIFLSISMKVQHDVLVDKGQLVSAIVVDNAMVGTSRIIHYQYSYNGRISRKDEKIEGAFQGRNVEEWKQGDRIEILFFNGKSTIKGNYGQNFKILAYYSIGLLIILIWALRKRHALSKLVKLVEISRDTLSFQY